MNDDLSAILAAVADGEVTATAAAEQIKKLYALDLGHSTLDLDRARRNGAGEVIYAEGKTPAQVAEIFTALAERADNVLATRASIDHADAVAGVVADVEYDPSARVLVRKTVTRDLPAGTIAVVSAGTSDASVADEAAAVASFYDNRVLRISDVGVAGLHRLLARLPELQAANVLIVVAGMEGALPSVVGGLVDRPVIAVPTSVGYGAAFGGVAALLGMLNTCASGVSVVNIDNGFGAGYLASMINRERIAQDGETTSDD
ncbi:MAG: nickel pincer cofactor biosynthesis protein LarB [Pseudomonadaceae bacterium]|nr:nickel pincer cofactor biosynthesis protein LarB [Pseudomonadaceae bacterium]